MSQPSASMSQQVKGQLEAKLSHSCHDQSSQTPSFNPNFANKEQVAPGGISVSNPLFAKHHDLAEATSEGGFSPINPLQKFDPAKSSPVTFIAPSSIQGKMKRIKKTSNAIKGNNNGEDPSTNERTSSKDSTNKIESGNDEFEGGPVNVQNKSQIANVSSTSTLPSTAEHSFETQSLQSLQNLSGSELQQNSTNSGNYANINSKSHNNSQGTGSTASSSKNSSPRKLSAGSGRFGNFQKNASGSSESLTAGQGGDNNSNQNQGGYYVNRSGGYNRNSNKMNSPKKKYSGGSSGGYNRQNDGKFRSNNNRNAPSQQYNNKHGNSGAMGHKKKMQPPPQSTVSNSSNTHPETALSISTQQQPTHGHTDDARSMSPSLLALLTAHASQANDPNVSPVPPIQTQQANLVTSHLEKSLMSNYTSQSSATTYLSPTMPNRNSATSGCVTQNWAHPVNAVRTNAGGSALEQMVSSVVITQPPFQPTSAAIAARPNVNSESASFFAGNQYAVPTVRDVNNNTSGIHCKGSKPETYQNSYGNNNGTFSSKKKNRNQQGHKNYNSQNSNQNRSNFNVNSSGPPQNVNAGVVPFGYAGLPLANSTPLSLSTQPHLPTVAATNAGLSPATAVLPPSSLSELGGLNDILQRIQLNPLQFTVPGLTNSLNLLNASMAFQAAGNVGASDQTGGQMGNSACGDHVSCPSPSSSTNTQNNSLNVTPTNNFVDLSLQSMLPNLNPKVTNLGVRDNSYNQNNGASKSGGNSGPPGPSNTDSALQFLAALQQVQNMSALASGYNPSGGPHLIEPSKFFYNLVAQYPSQMYGTQPLLTSFFNTMMNNPLNTPVSVSTPPINPMASSQPVVNTSTAPSSRGDGNAYNGNPYYQTQNSGPPNTPIHRKNMPDLTEYSNHGYNGSASVSAVDMNNQHIRLNNSAPPFESNRNCNAVISDTQSKGPSPVQSEEWNRKKKVKRAENAPVLATAHKKFNSPPTQTPSKKGTFCVVTPDEIGSSSFHCTELTHPIFVQIWNPTIWAVSVTASIQKLAMDNKCGVVESPFSVENCFMLNSKEKTFLKIDFKSNSVGTYNADLVIEAKPVQTTADKVHFAKTIKMTASATDVIILKYIRNLDGGFEPLGDHFELANMKPGSTYRTDVLFENRSQALSTLLVNFHEDRGSTVTVVALNGVELPNPLNKLSFDTHGYVDLGGQGHVNYHTVCMTVEVFIPTTWRDNSAALQFALYATISSNESKSSPVKFLHSTTFNVSVVQPKLYIPPHAQHIELHELALTQNVPVRNCSAKQLQLTLRCNNSAFIVNPVELELQPYTVVPIAITYDQRYKREQASVIITVEPEGPVYTVNVDGKALQNEKPLSIEPPGKSSASPNTSICSCQKSSRKMVSSTPVVTDGNSLSQSVNVGDESVEEIATSIEVSKKAPVVDKRKERRMDLKTRIVLSSVEYLFFAGGSTSKPEQLSCLFKNNSSCYAKWKFSVSQASRIFSLAKVSRLNGEGEVLNAFSDGVTVAPQEVLKVTVLFQCANSKLDFLTGFLIISPTYNDGYSTGDDDSNLQNMGYPTDGSIDLSAVAASRMVVPSYFDAPRDLEDPKTKSPDFRLPLYAYTGNSFIKATVKQHANVKWNTPATVSIRNTGDRFAYVVVTSSHAADASPNCFSLPPNGETSISKLYCKSTESDGATFEITWGDAILKHAYDQFSSGMCLQTSKQIHSFLVAPYQINDAHNHSDKLPKREFNLNPQLLTRNIYSTQVCLTLDSKKPKIIYNSLSQETVCSIPENAVCFDKPTEADFPRLVASPASELGSGIGSGKSKFKSETKPWSLTPQNLILEFGNASYKDKKSGLVKLVGNLVITNNSNDSSLDCEISCSNEKIKLNLMRVQLGSRDCRDISVEVLMKTDFIWPSNGNNAVAVENINLRTPFAEIQFKLKFEDRELRIRPPIYDKMGVFLPGSKQSWKAQDCFQTHKILDADFEDASYLSQCWQVQFPQTKTGDWANACLTFSNLTKGKLKWTLTSMCNSFISVTSSNSSPLKPSIAPPSAVEPEFSKPTGPSVTLYKVRQQVFRFERTSGFLDSGATAVIRAEFAPYESGDFIQHWELSLQKRAVGDGEKATRIQRVYLKGHGHGWGRMKNNRDVSPKRRLERIDFISDLPSELRDKFVVFVTESVIRFDETSCGSTDRKFIFVRNADASKQHQVKFLNPEPPFVMNHGGYEIGTRRILKVPVVFKPTAPGTYSSFFLIITDTPSKSVIPTFLIGVAVKPKSKTTAEPMAALSSEQAILDSPTSCDTTNDGEAASRIKSQSDESFDECIKYTDETTAAVFANSSTVPWPSHSIANSESLFPGQTCTSTSIVETQYMPSVTSSGLVPSAASEDSVHIESMSMSDIPEQISNVEELKDGLSSNGVGDGGYVSATVLQQGPAPLAQVPQSSVTISATVANVVKRGEEANVAEHVSDGHK